MGRNRFVERLELAVRRLGVRLVRRAYMLHAGETLCPLVALACDQTGFDPRGKSHREVLCVTFRFFSNMPFRAGFVVGFDGRKLPRHGFTPQGEKAYDAGYKLGCDAACAMGQWVMEAAENAADSLRFVEF